MSLAAERRTGGFGCFPDNVKNTGCIVRYLLMANGKKSELPTIHGREENINGTI